MDKDLRNYMNDEDICITDDRHKLNYTGYLDICMPSDTMREYLKRVGLSPYTAINLIMYSPVSIYIKREELLKIQDEVIEGEDAIHWYSAMNAIDLALSYLDRDGIFTLSTGGYYDYNNDTDEGLEYACDIFQDVKEHIHEYETIEEYEPDDLAWFNVTKWVKGDNGKYVDACDYYFVREELVYISFGIDIFKKDMEYIAKTVKYPYDEMWISDYDVYGGENLNLPVPFKAGDIISCDGFPFGPKSRVLVLKIGDNIDCCCVQGLALGPDGEWLSGALKHGHLQHGYSPKVSPLYTATLYEGELSEEELILKEISDMIGGSEEKGRTICEKTHLLSFRGEIDEESVKTLRFDAMEDSEE